MSIREKYRQFRQWQKNPLDFKTDTTQYHCLNCGEQFTGNYCPTCGQKASAGRFTWKSVRQSVLDLWGLGSRSLPYSLWQLLWRPGYLMRDYISGKMQVCFPPVKMLIVVALLVSLSGFVDTGGEEGGYMGNDWLGYVLDKLLSQMQWAMHSPHMVGVPLSAPLRAPHAAAGFLRPGAFLCAVPHVPVSGPSAPFMGRF